MRFLSRTNARPPAVCTRTEFRVLVSRSCSSLPAVARQLRRSPWSRRRRCRLRCCCCCPCCAAGAAALPLHCAVQPPPPLRPGSVLGHSVGGIRRHCRCRRRCRRRPPSATVAVLLATLCPRSRRARARLPSLSPLEREDLCQTENVHLQCWLNISVMVLVGLRNEISPSFDVQKILSVHVGCVEHFL